MKGVPAVASRNRARTFGSMRLPARANRDMLVNSPAGFPSGFGPVNGFTPGGPWDTTSDTPAFWWVGADGGDVIGPHGPFTGRRMLASVERATDLIVGNVAGLPWRVYRGSWRGDQSGDELPVPLWASDPMLIGSVPGVAAPVRALLDRRSAFGVWAGWLRDALWWGRGYLAFQPSASGEPLAGTIRNLSPAAVDCDEDGQWWLGRAGDYDSARIGFDGDIEGTGYRLLPMGEPFGDGTGVMGRHAASLGLAVEVRGYASGTFRSGVPAGYLKVTAPGLTQEQADKLRSRWLEAHGGNQRSIAVLNATTDFNAVSVSPVDAQLVEVDHMALRMVAHAFNLGAWALDAGSTGNDYANITDRRQDRTDDTLMPWKRVFEESVSAVLRYGTWLELDVRGWLQTDPLKRTAYYQAMTGLGAMTSQEVRRLERMPPLPAAADSEEVSVDAVDA